jgi:2-hydroxychromene-2-carboxylate isomerase
MFRLRGWGSWADTGERARRVAEIEERARRYGLPPLVWPSGWPCNSLAANRAAVWAAQQGAVGPYARALFRREFAEGADITQLSILSAAAAEVGLDPAQLGEAIGRQETKDALRRATEAAWARGVRGVPTTEVGGRLFFGDDRLDEVAAWLRSGSRSGPGVSPRAGASSARPPA